MREQYDWSASFGRWLGIPFRIDVLLVLFILVIFAFDWHFRHLNQGVSNGFVTAVVLLICLLVHELAHVVAAVNLGAQVHWIALTPWGGHTSMTLPVSNRAKLIIYSSGLMVSTALFCLAAILLIQAGQARLEDLINPFRPRRFQVASWPSSLLTIFAWINAQLVFINLIPCYPFDGGKILRVLFASVNRELSRVKIESTLMAIGQLTGVIVMCMALFFQQTRDGIVDPPWAYFVGMGIILIFAARHEYRRQLKLIQVEEGWDDDLSNEPWDEHLAFDDADFSFAVDEGYSQWLVEKQWQREVQQQQQLLDDELEDEHRFDQILRKVHADGIESLDEDERRVLERVSARVRRRREIDSA